ncbi:MAG: hypothetical protein NVSMB7_00210 [Chitinophagaceae bacterium]
MWNLFSFLRRKNVCHIPSGTVVHGGVETAGSLVIHGAVYGDIQVASSLFVGKSGVIVGNIHTSTMIVYGKIQGNVTALLKGVIKDNAVVTGYVNASPLVIEKKASIDGKLNTTPEERNEAMPSTWI